jgi:uncharacterized protein with NRDE domain
MCVVALALDQHSDWPIILIGNRDEFHARDSAPLHHWEDGSGIIAGRDLVSNGTWLGVNPALGRLVVVTNVRSDAPPDPAKASRGTLVQNLLTGHGPFADPAAEELDAFNGFNLMALSPSGARLLTNRPRPAIRLLEPGLHALANAAAANADPRADRLAAAWRDWRAEAEAPAALLDRLTDTRPPPLFLSSDSYGTRCTTLVAIDAAGRGTITERRYAKGGIPMGETALSFAFAG